MHMGKDLRAFISTIVVVTLKNYFIQLFIHLFNSTQINSIIFTSYRQTYVYVYLHKIGT